MEAAVILFSMFLGILVASLPLYLALKSLGVGRTITKVILVNLLSGMAVSMLGLALGRLTLGNWYFYLFVVLLVYKGVLEISWPKALVAWLLTGIVSIIFVLLFLSLGLGVLASLSLPAVG